MNIFGRLCGIVFLFSLVLPYAASGSKDAEQTYNLPASEIKEVIVSWLESNRFQVFNVGSTPFVQTLEIKDKNLHWRISLYTQSPLATRVSLQNLKGETDPRLTGFWDHLNGYVAIPSEPSTIPLNTIPGAVRDALEAVVCIYAKDSTQKVQISGFVIDSKGLILSTAHNLSSGQVVSVQFRDGRETKGRVTKLDEYRDLCIIKVSDLPKGSAIISLQDGRYMPGRQDLLYALSCPGAGLDGIQSGSLHGPPRRVDGLPLWQVKMHIQSGGSGSPVLDDHGRLSAVVKGRFRGNDTIGYLIPFETLLHFLEKY